MKSILLTLCCAMFLAVSYGQVPASYLTKAKPIPFVNVASKPVGSGAQRGVSSFEVSYHDMESEYAADNSFDFGYFGWELNKNFNVSCSPLDSTDDNTITWGAVVFDSIYDYVNATPYKKSTFNSMTVDSVFFLYSHQNVSGLSDTVIVSIYAVANTPSKIAYAAGNKEFTNTLLWSDTTITTTSLTANATQLFYGFRATGGVTIPQGQGFVIRIDYAGPKADKFTIADGNRLECGSSVGAASVSVIPNNTFRYFVGGNFTPAPCTNFSGIGALTYPSLPANCRQFYFQNLALSAVVSVDAPLAVSSNASQAIGCPGQSVVLNALASGGSGDFSYTWSGNGTFTSPTSASTSVTLPTGNQTVTYSVSVVDNVENTTVTNTVNVVVRGITVDLGIDTIINCGDSVLLVAQLGGYPNNATFAWSNGANTQQQYVKNGTYTVTVTNSFSTATPGCSATDTKVVSLNVAQNLSFTATSDYTRPAVQDTALLGQNRVCPSATIDFPNTSSDTTNWDFLWDYGYDSLQSTLTNGSVSYPTAGDYTVKLTATNSTGCIITTAPFVVKVQTATFPRCSIVGIAEVELLSNISLYPNPNTGSFIVDLSKVNANEANVMVVDMLGKVVFNSNNFSTSVNPVQTITMNNAANGLYFVRITADGVTATSKISVAK
ncbi:hypothetical protein BH09BAC1_BH09BAC1_23860 [soil metagenome]